MGHWPRLDVNVQDVGVSQIPTDKVDRGGDRMAGSLDFAGYPLQGIVAELDARLDEPVSRKRDCSRPVSTGG